MKKEKVQKTVEVTTPKYDATKNYKWNPTDKFEISGEEFALILNSLRSIVISPLAQPFLFAAKANEISENILARSVAVGIAKENTEAPKQQ